MNAGPQCQTLKQLRKVVVSLIRKSNPHGIIRDGFWETFEKEYGYKPNPRDFGKVNLIQLFDLFPNVTIVRKESTKRKKKSALYICLKTGEAETTEREANNETPNTRKQALDKKKKSDTTETETHTQGRTKEKQHLKGDQKTRPDSYSSSGVDGIRATEISQLPKRTSKADKIYARNDFQDSDKEMEKKGYIFHTYGRDRSSSRERSEERKYSSGGQRGETSHSRLPMWLSGTDESNASQSPSMPSHVPHNTTGRQQVNPLMSNYNTVQGVLPSTSRTGVPLVYGMNFPSFK